MGERAGERQAWIDWRRMNPMVDPGDIDEIDRRLISAQQQPADANKSIEES